MSTNSAVMPLCADSGVPLRVSRTQRCEYCGIERHRRDRPGIGREHFGDTLRQPHVAFKAALDLDQERHAPGNERAELGERQHAVGAPAEIDDLELGCGQRRQRAAADRQAAELEVVMHHRLAVARELHVAFDAVAAVYRRLKG